MMEGALTVFSPTNFDHSIPYDAEWKPSPPERPTRPSLDGEEPIAWKHLPSDVLREVAGWLDEWSLTQLELTCRTLARVVAGVWKEKAGYPPSTPMPHRLWYGCYIRRLRILDVPPSAFTWLIEHPEAFSRPGVVSREGLDEWFPQLSTISTLPYSFRGENHIQATFEWKKNVLTSLLIGRNGRIWREYGRSDGLEVLYQISQPVAKRIVPFDLEKLPSTFWSREVRNIRAALFGPGWLTGPPSDSYV